MNMGIINRSFLAGLLAAMGSGCVYVPADLYYGTAPRSTPHREYYVEEYYGPAYAEPERYRYRRQQELRREEARGYRDQRRGRARTDALEEREERRIEESRRERRESREEELAPVPPPSRSQESKPEPRKTEPSKPEKTEVPLGTRTSNPNRVKSPYAPHNELDVTGLKSGSLARDPTTGKVFRLP